MRCFMKSDRLIRVNELIRREIAANLSRFAHGMDMNVAAVTITRVVAASNLRSARVWVSVLSGSETVARVIGMLLERRTEIQAHLGRTLRLKYTPRLFFVADDSLEQGDRVLDLLNHLPVDGHAGEDTPAPEEWSSRDG